MKLTVLIDNNTIIDKYYIGEPAVCYYIEDDNEKILFDTGYSNAFIKNAKLMDINLDKVNKIIISHGHEDHTGGLKYFLKTRKKIDLIAHPECFIEKEENGIYIGSPLNIKQLSKKVSLKLSKEPIKLNENLFYLGEIPNTFDYETRIKIGKKTIDGEVSDDYVMDDSALVYKSDRGLFIITGCSHSGICNITEYAKKICDDERILGIIGGFHLFEVDERLDSTIRYFKDNNIEMLYPCHCTSLKAKIKINEELEVKEVGVGTIIEI